ncbi:MAG TPA: BlaI/MecI/CopY family transcriptional regulator [Longimicrobiales bacterium]|nr:BlaI/MecI/CopY family transcriptional regulator [Longimicrobiales bacterium]
MARKRSPTLTEAELRLMKVLWESGPSTVGEVLDALPNRVSLAYSTVRTTLRILEQKGYVRHEKNGRAFVYHPLVDRSDARRSAVRYVVSRFFNDSPELLVLNVLEGEELNEGDMKRLKKLIEESD